MNPNQALIDSINAQIATLMAMIGGGITQNSYDGRSVSLDDYDGLVRRLEFLQRQLAALSNPGRRRPTVGYASFSKGYTHQGFGYRYNRWGF